MLILFGIAVAIGIQALSSTERSSLLLEERYQQLRVMDELKYLSTDLTLLFMDIIVDKDSGSVSAERIQLLRETKKQIAIDPSVPM